MIFGILLALILVLCFVAVFAAALVGITGAMFLEVPFGEGWDAAWYRPLFLAVYVVVAGVLTTGFRVSAS